MDTNIQLVLYISVHLLDYDPDPFMGSGTIAVAALELGRQFIGFEHNKKYHTIANNRLNGTNANGQTSFLLR